MNNQARQALSRRFGPTRYPSPLLPTPLLTKTSALRLSCQVVAARVFTRKKHPIPPKARVPPTPPGRTTPPRCHASRTKSLYPKAVKGQTSVPSTPFGVRVEGNRCFLPQAASTPPLFSLTLFPTWPAPVGRFHGTTISLRRQASCNLLPRQT